MTDLRVIHLAMSPRLATLVRQLVQIEQHASTTLAEDEREMLRATRDEIDDQLAKRAPVVEVPTPVEPAAKTVARKMAKAAKAVA